MFREGRTKAVGNVTKLIPIASLPGHHGALGAKNKPMKHKPNQQHPNAPKSAATTNPTAGTGAKPAQNDENSAPNPETEVNTKVEHQDLPPKAPPNNPKKNSNRRGGGNRNRANSASVAGATAAVGDGE